MGGHFFWNEGPGAQFNFILAHEGLKFKFSPEPVSLGGYLGQAS